MVKINPNQDYLKDKKFSLAPCRRLSVDVLIVLLAKFVMYPALKLYCKCCLLDHHAIPSIAVVR